MSNVKILLDREGYRFVEVGIIELNGMPDYRLQKQNIYTQRWTDEYLFDNQMQCALAMEDIEYAKWLCGDNAYVKDNVCSPYN